MTSFKIFFSPDNIRRLSISTIPTYTQFLDFLLKTYIEYNPKSTIHYYDAEGDKITITTQLEWEEIFEQFPDGSIKVYIEALDTDVKTDEISEPEKCSLKEESEKFVLDGLAKLKVEFGKIPNREESEKMILDGLEKLADEFGKITSDISDKISGFDLDENFCYYQEKAICCMESLDKNVIQKGRDYFAKMLEMVPNHAMTLYNMACAEALLKNVNGAITYLEKAVENGYNNVKQMMQDKNLDLIRGTEAFNNIVAKLKKMLNLEEKVNEEYEQDKKLIEVKNTFLTESFVDLRHKWSDKIKEIKSMGFLIDDEVLSLLFEQYNGKLDDVINILVK